MDYRLLEKTELWISPVELSGADLGACAAAVGRVLGLGETEIMVTDALNETLALDILVPTIPADRIVAKEGPVLTALSSVAGVTVFPDTHVHSRGVLGLITLDEAQGAELLSRSEAMRKEIEERIASRAIVMATGAEVLEGRIKDTNTPYLVERLKDVGFEVVQGPKLADDADSIARALNRAAEEAYGLVVTTGGVGAEGKDQTVEAVCSLDPDAATPPVLMFHKGQGRHHKSSVRIGVGRRHDLLMVCLPGPHDEVEMLWPILSNGLSARWDKKTLADALASRLRDKFLSHRNHHGFMAGQAEQVE